MHEVNKSYYAIIPANVRYDKELTANAKLLYGELTALSNEKGFCWATNNYFAELYDTSDRSIQRWIKNLADKGYITIELIRKENSVEVLQRNIYIGNDKNVARGQKCREGDDKNVLNPGDKNVVDNNTLINNTSNIGEKENPIYKEVIEYLNLKADTKYKYSAKMNKDLINARINDKYTLEDFKTVIDNKCNSWLNTDYEKFLRPQTLFSNKFEGYLNEKPKGKVNKATVNFEDYID